MASPFLWPVRVYYEDTDIGGVVYYANYLRFFERARTEWLRALGFNQFKFAEEEDRAFVVRRAEIDYRRAARMDDLLQVSVQPLESGRASLWVAQRIVRENPNAKEVELIAEAKIQVACVRRSDGIPVKLPPLMFDHVQQTLAAQKQQ